MCLLGPLSVQMIISGCWVGYWAFLFFAMTSYAAVHPASLGWSTNTLQSSFGLLRFAFFMVSIFASLLIASFFELWHTDNVVEAWAEFQQTPWLSAKKLLYVLLMIQAVRVAPAQPTGSACLAQTQRAASRRTEGERGGEGGGRERARRARGREGEMRQMGRAQGGRGRAAH